MQWYRDNRDLATPDFCKVHLYSNWEEEFKVLERHSIDADVVVIGSYFPDAIALTNHLAGHIQALTFFYDIDTPITVRGLRITGHVDYLSANLIPQFAAYLSFSGGPLLREVVDIFGAQKAFPLYCSVDASIYQPVAARFDFACDLSYLGTYAADRQQKLTAWLDETARRKPNRSFLVAGSQYPESMIWLANVRHLDHVSPSDHPSFYSSSRFTLNLTRRDMITAGWSPSIRLFEAAACGTAIVSDYWSGLDTIFAPGNEILIPSTADDLAYILDNLSESERKQLGARARERVLAEHTSEHRAIEFEEIVSKCT